MVHQGSHERRVERDCPTLSRITLRPPNSQEPPIEINLVPRQVADLRILSPALSDSVSAGRRLGDRVPFWDWLPFAGTDLTAACNSARFCSAENALPTPAPTLSFSDRSRRNLARIPDQPPDLAVGWPGTKQPPFAQQGGRTTKKCGGFLLSQAAGQ